MKNLLRVVALFVVVVLVASGCSYSEEAEPGVRNLARSSLEKSSPSTDLVPHLSDDCETMGYSIISLACLSESEQHRAAGLFNSVKWLVKMDDAVSLVGSRWEFLTRLLKQLIDFEALEVLCYMPVLNEMLSEEDEWWRTDSVVEDFRLFERLFDLRTVVLSHMSTAKHRTDTPVLESVRYRHLCPRWMQPFHTLE